MNFPYRNDAIQNNINFNTLFDGLALDGPLAQMLMSGSDDQARSILNHHIDLRILEQYRLNSIGTPARMGKIYNSYAKSSTDRLDEIMGMPPIAYTLGDPDYNNITVKKMLQSMIVIELHPALPTYAGISQDSMDLFRLNEQKGAEELQKILRVFNTNHLSSITQYNLPLKIAVMNDTSISENWGHEFGASMFEGAANIGSSTAQELRFVTGEQNIFSAMGRLGENLGGAFGGLAQNFMESGQALGDRIGQGLHEYSEMGREIVTRGSGPLGSGLMQLASGSMVDFPQIWRGSSYTTSYAFTTKLYNPDPGNQESYIKYIIKPLAHLLAFMTPLSDSNFTFSYPLICKVKCPGLFGMEAAVIQNMSVIKGGANNDISFNQQPGEVEVRFEIASLYNTMISQGERDIFEDRPTLDRYINHLLGNTVAPSIYGNEVSNRPEDQVNMISSGEPIPPGPRGSVTTGDQEDFILDVSLDSTTETNNRLSITSKVNSIDPIFNPDSDDPEQAIKNKRYLDDISQFENEADRIAREEDRIILLTTNNILSNSEQAELSAWVINNSHNYDQHTLNLMERTDFYNIYNNNELIQNTTMSGSSLITREIDGF